MSDYDNTDTSRYGSGTTGGAGFGNKTSGGGLDDDYDNSDVRTGSHGHTGAYSGGTEYGSGTTGGAGFGNKTGSHGESGGGGDSTVGKLMEKAGSVFKSEKLEEKGSSKRDAASHGGSSGRHGDDHDSYGSSTRHEGSGGRGAFDSSVSHGGGSDSYGSGGAGAGDTYGSSTTGRSGGGGGGVGGIGGGNDSYGSSGSAGGGLESRYDATNDRDNINEYGRTAADREASGYGSGERTTGGGYGQGNSYGSGERRDEY